jgi:hypothetical protein
MRKVNVEASRHKNTTDFVMGRGIQAFAATGDDQGGSSTVLLIHEDIDFETVKSGMDGHTIARAYHVYTVE